jgi:hypothetical protein
MAATMKMKKATLWTMLVLGSGLLSDCIREVPEAPLFDGFEADSIADFWQSGSYGSGRYAPGAVVVSRDHARSGHSSVRITVEEGDVEQRSDDGRASERAELDSGKYALRSHEIWYGFSFLIPVGFPVIDNRLVIAQWKQNKAAPPLVAQRFRKGQHYVTVNRPESLDSDNPLRYALPDIEFGAWNDMVYHFRYSSAQDGLVEIWMNGDKIVSHHGPTAVPDGPNQFYNKIGLYRDRWKHPMTIYFDNYTMGRGFLSVDPSRFDD